MGVTSLEIAKVVFVIVLLAEALFTSAASGAVTYAVFVIVSPPTAVAETMSV